MTLRYDTDLQAGLEYQDHVMKLFWKKGIPIMNFSSIKEQVDTGENLNGVEIKLDRKFRETGNFFIETAERSSVTSDYWKPSGIMKEDNSWAYAIGDYETLYVFSIKQLRWLPKLHGLKKVATPTSEGYLLPKEYAEKWCLFTL